MSTRARAASYGRLELVPGGPRAAQRRERGPRVALGEENGAVGVRGRRRISGASSCAASAVNSSAAARAARRRRRRARSPLRRRGAGARRVARVSSSARRIAAARGVELALHEPQQGQARLRLAAAAAGLPVCLLSLGELAAQPVQLGELVVGRAGGAGPAGRPGSRRRAGPRPARRARRRGAGGFRRGAPGNGRDTGAGRAATRTSGRARRSTPAPGGGRRPPGRHRSRCSRRADDERRDLSGRTATITSSSSPTPRAV